MDAATARTELLISTFTTSLHQLCNHIADAGDIEGLVDIRNMVDEYVDEALLVLQPVRRFGIRAL